MIKNLPVNAGDCGSISRLERSPGDGDDYPLQYSCLENPTDRGAWWATAHGVAKSWTRLKRLSMHPQEDFRLSKTGGGEELLLIAISRN